MYNQALKISKVILAVILSLLFLPRVGLAAISESDTYKAIFVNNLGSSLLSAGSYEFEGVLGQPISGYAYTSSEKTDAYFGIIPIITLLPPKDEYEIYDIRAYSFSTHEEVLAKTWQKHNDLYFVWKIQPFFTSGVVLGFSVGLDTEPDDTIDTNVAYFDGHVKWMASRKFWAPDYHTFRNYLPWANVDSYPPGW